MSEKNHDSFSAARRWSGWLNLALCIVSVLALAAMTNYLAHRHYKRIHWSKRLDNKLTERTLEVLKEIQKPVRVVIFFKQDDPLYRPVMELLRQYRLANPKISLETVDYERERGRAISIQSEFELSKDDHNLVIFQSEGRTYEVHKESLIGLNRAQFRGEQLFTSKLIALASTNTFPVYYLIDNGAHALEDTVNPDGYGLFKRTFQEMNVDLQPLSLSDTQTVPSDCRLLIVAGPRTDLSELEAIYLRDYLERGGRVWVMFRRENQGGPFLTSLLADCGVFVENQKADDPPNDYRHGIVRFRVNIKGVKTVHPAIKKLSAQGLSFRLSRPWVITPQFDQASIGNQPEIIRLLTTGPKGYKIKPKEPSEVNKSVLGHVSVGVAVEDKNPTDPNSPAMRLMVMGDSTWASNGLIDKDANGLLGEHIANWFLDRPYLLTIDQRRIRNHQYSITRQERRDLTAWLLGAVPGGVLGAGLLVWLRRRY